MFMHYATIEEDIEVTHSEIKNDNTIVVRIEIPDENLCFKVLEIKIPTLDIVKNEGFTEFEIKKYLRFCENNMSSIFLYSYLGGIKNA